MDASEAGRLKRSWDKLADDALDRLNNLDLEGLARKMIVPKPKPSSGQKRDLFCLLRDNAEVDPALSKLWEQANSVPEWVDWRQISRGQDVFYRCQSQPGAFRNTCQLTFPDGGPALTGLAFQSLLGGLGTQFRVSVPHSLTLTCNRGSTYRGSSIRLILNVERLH